MSVHARILLVGLLLLLVALGSGPAHAVDPPSCSVGSDAVKLLTRSVDWSDTGDTANTSRPLALTPKTRLRTAASQARIEFEVTRPQDEISVAQWKTAVLRGSARTLSFFPPPSGTEQPTYRPPQSYVARGPLAQYVVSPVEATLQLRDDDKAIISIEVPENRSGLFDEQWRVVATLCSPDLRSIIAFGAIDVAVSPTAPSIIIAVTIVVLVWLMLTFGAWRLHARRLQECYRAAHLQRGAQDSRGERLWWKFKRAVSPVFISQDLLGVASLSQLQLLLFTIAVAGVSLYAYLRNGTLPGLSSDVLQLLGITAVGTTFARIANLSSPISVQTRLLLIGNGIVKPDDRLPRLTDLVSNNGIIDITRVQALVFSGFAILALVVNGTSDLSAFKLPDYLNYLLGISQGVYVAGKLVPPENLKRLDDEANALRTAARTALAGGAVKGSPEMIAFDNAVATLRVTLRDVYEARFQEQALAALTPAQAA